MGIWYATREDVKSTLDVSETALSNAQVDRAIEAASRAVEGLTHRRFYPELATRYFDWPNERRGSSWRLWLDRNELVAITSITSGGTALDTANVFLEPANYGPPFDRVEINRGTTAAFNTGNTSQRAIAITGIFGYDLNVASAGTITSSLNAFTTLVGVSDSTAVGVGQLITVDSERMVVTEKSLVSTGQTITGALDVRANVVSVGVANGAAFNVGEVITVDAERMQITDIAGNNLIVKRAVDGSVLASHALGATVYAPRSLTVTRGVLGTTAASHTSGAAISKHVYPGLIHELCVAEAVSYFLQGRSGYARVVGSGDNQREAAGTGLLQIRTDAYAAYGRKARMRVV